MTKKKTTKPSSKATVKKPTKATIKASKATTKPAAKKVVKTPKKESPKTVTPVKITPAKVVPARAVKKDAQVIGKRESSILLFMVVLACLIFIGWNNPTKPFGFLKSNNSADGASTGKALIGGEFNLIDQNGQPFSSAALKGKKSLIFFGFTNCPSICPVSMAQITAVMEKVDANKIQPVFITVDPERDTPEVIKMFLQDYDSHFVGLTGTAQDLKAVEKAYKVYSNKVADATAPADEYVMDHSGLIYVMDENGEYLYHFSGSETTEEMAAKINSF